MYPDMFDDIASVGTVCNATASQQGDREIMSPSESSSWALSDVGKLNR